MIQKLVYTLKLVQTTNEKYTDFGMCYKPLSTVVLDSSDCHVIMISEDICFGKQPVILTP